MSDEVRPKPSTEEPPPKAELDLIKVPAEPLPEEEGERFERQEAEALDRERTKEDQLQDRERQLALDIKEHGLRQARHELAERTKYAGRLFNLILWWLVGIGGIILLQGFHRLPFWPHIRFRLSDPALLALIGGTTLNVLGIFVVVVNYLFPKRRDGRMF
ncbi:MAG TPA: hypothetical protein VKW76_13395 [Candidatus Binatia bacterium]|nr:hypothetical protein [Candidatus Binatia bacterium]